MAHSDCHVENRLSGSKDGNWSLGNCCSDLVEKDIGWNQESSSENLMWQESQDDEKSPGRLRFLAWASGRNYSSLEMERLPSRTGLACSTQYFLGRVGLEVSIRHPREMSRRKTFESGILEKGLGWRLKKLKFIARKMILGGHQRRE